MVLYEEINQNSKRVRTQNFSKAGRFFEVSLIHPSIHPLKMLGPEIVELTGADVVLPLRELPVRCEEGVNPSLLGWNSLHSQTQRLIRRLHLCSPRAPKSELVVPSIDSSWMNYSSTDNCGRDSPFNAVHLGIHLKLWEMLQFLRVCITYSNLLVFQAVWACKKEVQNFSGFL